MGAYPAIGRGGVLYDDAATIRTAISAQQTLVSGTSIKTVNGNSLLGSGDVTISGGLADIAANSLLGNNTGSTAAPTALSAAQVRTLLGLATTSQVTFDSLILTEQTPNQTVLSSTGYSLTGTNAQSLVSLAGTWNTTGTPTAIDLNITDTASNANSLLMNLRTGGASRFSVGKDGDSGRTIVAVNGRSGAAYTEALARFGNNGNALTVMGSGNNFGVFTNSGGMYGWAVNTSPVLTIDNVDLRLQRDAAGTLAQRNGTSAQISRIYKTFTSATNFETFEIDASSDASNYRLGSRIGSAGGTTRGLQLGSYNAAGTWTSWLGIGTTGQVSIGGTTTFNTSNYTLGTGTLVFQPFSQGNAFFAENAFWNGSSWTRINTGFATTFQMFNGQLAIGGAANGTGTFTNVLTCKVDHLGVTCIGGTAISGTLGTYTGAALVARPASVEINQPLTVSSSQILFSSLPTTNPGVAGRLWNDAGTLRIS